MRKHGWIYLVSLWWLLFATVALAESPAAPQDEPKKSLVFLFNTSLQEKDRDMVACTQQLLQPLWVHTLQEGGQAIVMQAEYKNDKPVTTPLTASSADEISAQLDQIPLRRNELVPDSNDVNARSVLYQLQAARDAMTTLRNPYYPVDLWIVNRFSEPVARWKDGSFSGEGYKPMMEAAQIVEQLLTDYSGLQIRMLFCSEKRSGDYTSFSQGVQSMLPPEIDAGRLAVEILSPDYVHWDMPITMDYLWALPPVAAQATETGYTAELTAGISKVLLRVEHPYDTVADITLLQDDRTRSCVWYSAGGYAWVTPTADLDTTKPVTLTLSGTAAGDAMRSDCTVLPLLHAGQSEYSATIVPECDENGNLYRGKTRLVVTSTMTEVPQELLTVSGELILPNGKGTQSLDFAPIASTEADHLQWACDVDLNLIGKYEAKFMASANLAFGARQSFTVLNRAPEVMQAEPFHAAINVPKAGNPALEVQLSDLFADADGDGLQFTLADGTDTAALSLDAKAGKLIFIPGQNATDGQATEVRVTANDGNGGTAETAITLVCDDFLTKMDGLVFEPMDGTLVNPTINVGETLTLAYGLTENKSFQWYHSMKDAYGAGVMPELVDALEIAMIDDDGNRYTTADESLDGLCVTLTAGAESLPVVTVHVPASGKAGTQRLKFSVAYQGETLGSTVPVLANANITVANTAPQLNEGLAAQQSATLLFNDLPFVGGKPLSMGQSLHEDVIPASMFQDTETPDSLRYAVSVEGTATLNGTALTDDQRLLTEEEASTPLDIQLGQVGRTTVTITASDGELTASRGWSLTLISLLMVVITALVVLVMVLILVLLILHLRRPTFAGKAICLEQHGEGHTITMSKDLWLDGMTLAQAAIMAGILPYDQLTAEILAGIRIEPLRRKTYRLTVSGKAAQISLYNADTRTLLPIKEPLRENNKYDVVLNSCCLRIIIGDPSAIDY